MFTKLSGWRSPPKQRGRTATTATTSTTACTPAGASATGVSSTEGRTAGTAQTATDATGTTRDRQAACVRPRQPASTSPAVRTSRKLEHSIERNAPIGRRYEDCSAASATTTATTADATEAIATVRSWVAAEG